MKIDILENLIGCRIQTHYGTSGIVTSYSGPYEEVAPLGKGCYTIRYRHEDEVKPSCWINSIKIENGVITCEGIPLKILDREENVQTSLF